MTLHEARYAMIFENDADCRQLYCYNIQRESKGEIMSLDQLGDDAHLLTSILSPQTHQQGFTYPLGHHIFNPVVLDLLFPESAY